MLEELEEEYWKCGVESVLAGCLKGIEDVGFFRFCLGFCFLRVVGSFGMVLKGEDGYSIGSCRKNE